MKSRVPVILGNTKNRDHFPFQTRTGDGTLSDPVVYPLVLDLTTALRWTWLVKTWKINGSFKFEVLGDDLGAGVAIPPFPQFDAVMEIICTDLLINVTTPIGFTIASEERQTLDYFNVGVPPPSGFVPGNRGSYFHSGTITMNSTITGSGPAPPGYSYVADTTFMSSLPVVNITRDIYWRDGIGYQPSVEFGLGATFDFHSHYAGRTPQDEHSSIFMQILCNAGALHNPTPEGGTWVNTHVGCDIDGNSLDIWEQHVSANTGFLQAHAVGGMIPTVNSFTLEPAEFFPFSTLAGLDVWDASSGASVNDPFS